MDVFEIKARYGLRLPSAHVRCLLDATDLIHQACDFLCLTSEHDLLDFGKVNTRLHEPGRWNAWPPYLVAFASNGCGDYFAYDTRSDPPTIVYIDPLETPEESLSSPDPLTYKTFEEWHASRLELHAELNP